MHAHRTLVALALSAAPLTTLSTAVADAPADVDRPRAPYLDGPIELGIDPTMIAVFVDASRAGASLDAALAAADLGGAAVQASSVPGWTYVELPEAEATDAGARRAVARIAANGRIDMASLVYLGGTAGLPVIPTRDLLVSFAPDATPAQQRALLAAHDATIVERDAAGTPGLVRARTTVATGDAMLELALAVDADPRVAWAQSDRIFWAERHGAPNDPLFGQQWALEQANDQDMDALGAWDVTTGDASIAVVVLDSGAQQTHPDLSQLPGQTFTGSGSGGNPANSCDNHGTAVAGCISATIDNASGIVGIAPGARARAAKVFNETSFFGFCLPFLESQDSWTVAGIQWAQSSGARVTNSSWGGGAASSAISSAFASTRAAGVVHVAAAGNDGTSTIGFPASLPTVNAVAALDASGNRASFSTYGAGLFISAPGAGILTTDRTGGDGYESGSWATVDGTSFASPYVAGVAALVLSVDPSLTPDEVEDVLAQTAVDRGAAGYDTGYGWGFVNAAAAVGGAGGTGCPTDLDGNGAVEFNDVLFLLAVWGDCAGCDADFDGSGTVDFNDVLTLLSAFGPCP